MRTFYTAKEVWALNWLKNPVRPRGMAGVYLITNKDTRNVIYVGQAAHLHNRLCPSVHPVYKKELHDVYILVEQDRNERRYMEARFISLLKPSINQRFGLKSTVAEDVMAEYYRKIFN